MSAAPYLVYEVFLREKPDQVLTHVGDVEAPDATAALFFAKEHLLRREPVDCLWVVEREHIHVSEWPLEVLNSGSNKRYRRTPGRSSRGSTA